MDIDPGLVETTFLAALFIVPLLALLAVLWWREWRRAGEGERQECESDESVYGERVCTGPADYLAS